MSGSDVQSRRNILQGLQQTRSRLQKQHSEDPHKSSLPHSRGSHTHSIPRPSPMYPSQQQGYSKPHLSPSPTPALLTTSEHNHLAQQQKLAMQQVTSQSYGYFISQPSNHNNVVLPVLPRFDSSGQFI